MANPLFDELFGKHLGQDTIFLQMANGDTITHDDFLKTSAQYAHLFAKLNIKTGDRIAVQVEKSPQCLAIYAACAQSGVIFLPLNTGYTPNEVTYFIENSGAALLICDESNVDELAPITQKLGTSIETLNADGTGTLSAKAKPEATSFETVDRNKDDLAAILYTSGTTGRSKGAMLTQENLLSNARTLVKAWKFTSDDVLLHALPIFHTHGLFVATNISLLAGNKIIFLPKYNLDEIVSLLPQATTMMGVPTFYTRLLNDTRFTSDLAKHMRLFISGSAPLLAETHIEFEERTGHRILERYGMTETNMNTSNPYDGERHAGTVGFALEGTEVKVTHAETGIELSADEIGLIEVRGPNVFKGYWQMPEKTAEELREDGFFITGDLGKFDTDGYLHIVGRNKDLIISGGYNIYPKEVELLLDEQDAVLESAVIGVPHPDFGETVVGILVPKPNEEIDLTAISEKIAKSLARFKQPNKLIVVAELPRNTMGKVQKNALREEYKNLFTQSQ